MAMSEKVVSLGGVGEVYEQIERFLENRGRKSMNTYEAYKRGIKNFFEIVRNKPLEFLNTKDIQIEFEDFEDFVRYLSEQGKLNNKTINQYVSSVAELLRYLHVKKIVEDISCLSSLKLIRLPENDNEYGVLTLDEVWDFAKWVKENEKKMADVKYYFILFSLDTCLRRAAVLSMTWDDFEVLDDKVIVKTVDKGNKDFRGAISKDFYNQILELKDKYKTDKVFKIGASTMQDTLNRWKESRNIQKNRNIVIHSIRKCGGTFQYRITGDILQAQKALGHSNLSTTQRYLQKEEYGAIGAVSSGGGVDPDLYKNVDRDTLIKAIENIKGYNTLLNIELNKIINETE